MADGIAPSQRLLGTRALVGTAKIKSNTKTLREEKKHLLALAHSCSQNQLDSADFLIDGLQQSGPATSRSGLDRQPERLSSACLSITHLPAYPLPISSTRIPKDLSGPSQSPSPALPRYPSTRIPKDLAHYIPRVSHGDPTGAPGVG